MGGRLRTNSPRRLPPSRPSPSTSWPLWSAWLWTPCTSGAAQRRPKSRSREQTEQFDDMETFASVDMTGIHLEHMVVADTGGSGMGMGMGDGSDSSATFATPVQFDSMQGLV